MLNKIFPQGYRTLILARFYTFIGAVVALHDIAMPYIAGVDWTPVTSRFHTWVVPVFVASTGILFEVLRRFTTTAVGEKPVE
jgi:hypothetical protein